MYGLWAVHPQQVCVILNPQPCKGDGKSCLEEEQGNGEYKTRRFEYGIGGNKRVREDENCVYVIEVKERKEEEVMERKEEEYRI